MTLAFSVVTPSYNQAKFIERTIKSVLCQDVDYLEYIIFDGQSTDETVDIIKRYESRLKWKSENDSGQAEAVNKGLKATVGQIIGWINSDDIYYPGAFHNIVEFFQSHPDVDVIYGDAYHVDEQDDVIEPYYTEAWNYERLKEVCYLCQPAVFFRRRAVARFGMLNERLHYCLDYEFWLRLARGGAKFAHLPIVLAGSRLHPETKTLGARVKVHREINEMMRDLFGQVPDRWLYNYAHAVVETHRFRREHRVRFTTALSIVSLYAALRWNRSVSRDMLHTLHHWIAENARTVLREVWPR